MPCGVVELGGRLCESTHTISKEDGSMWGVVFAFASVWCPERAERPPTARIVQKRVHVLSGYGYG
jgi:hypothetical protein